MLHVGAHKGEEFSDYQNNSWGNIVWVEAQPDLVRELTNRLPVHQNIVIEAAVWDESEVELNFNVASNRESFSLLDFGSHAKNYPQIEYLSSNIIATKGLDEIIPIFEFANFLDLDVQWVEV